MKFTVLLFILLFTRVAAMTQQLQLINEDVSHPDTLVVFNSHVNHFKLTGKDDLHPYGLMLTNGLVTYTGDGTYLVRNLSKAPVQISVFRRDEKSDKQKVVFTRVYQVQDIGNCTVQLIQEQNDTLSNKQVVNQTRLEPVFENKNYNGPSSVAHFEISLMQADTSKTIDHLFVSGKFLGVDVVKKIRELKKGGQLLFTQVVLYTYDGMYQRVDDVSFSYNKFANANN